MDNLHKGQYRVSVWSELPKPGEQVRDGHAVDRLREKVDWYGPRYFDAETEARAEAERLHDALVDLQSDLPMRIVIIAEERCSGRVLDNRLVDG